MEDIANIIKENEGLIYKIINKYRTYFEIEDLYQVAVMGLVKATKKYDNKYNTKFISYAYPYILGEVLKYVNDYRTIKTSREYKNLYCKILKAIQILSQKLMKIPTTSELSLFLEIDETTINEVLSANSMVESLDKVINEDDKSFELYDKHGYYDSAIEYYSLKSELEKLPKEELDIINARYYNDMTQAETGSALGMYQMEVSRKEKKILKKLKDKIET